MKMPRPGQLVICEWVDITSDDSWLTDQEAQGAEPINAVSVGWVLNSDRTALRLYSTVCEEDGTKNVLCIPRGTIKKVRGVKHGQ